MLTWTDGPVLVWEDLLSNLQPIYKQELPLPLTIGEGWGLTHDSDYLYISNGSTQIFVCTPRADKLGFNIVRTINVDVGDRIVYFNELELVENEYIYANNFMTDEIYKFRIDNGSLVKVWNVQELMKRQKDYVIKLGQLTSYDFGNNVLNGIAYNKQTKTFWLTGKRWDFMFEVNLVE